MFLSPIVSILDDEHSDKINKQTTNYDQSLLAGDQECNVKLLGAFGVNGEKRSKDAKTTASEKSFCRRNKRSCCSSFNIQSTNMAFAKGSKALREKFEVVEELFSLFRGPLFMEYITEHAEKGTCKEEVKDLSINLGGKEYDYFTPAYQRYEIMMIENLLMDVVIYVKKNLWFYGNLICSACNPDIQNYFKMNKDGSELEVHTNTCSEMMEEREFERNLLLLYNNYLHKTIKFVECVEDIKVKEEDPDAEDEDDFAFVNLNIEETDEFLTNFDTCWDDQNVKDSKCVEFCTKSLRLYKFPINHLMHNYKVSLDIMYKALTGIDIKEYYENIKDSEWNIDHENDAIAFFAQNELWTEFKFDTLKWSYHSSKGHNIYKEIMSKKYLDFDSILIKGVAIFTALTTLFLIK